MYAIYSKMLALEVQAPILPTYGDTIDRYRCRPMSCSTYYSHYAHCQLYRDMRIVQYRRNSRRDRLLAPVSEQYKLLKKPVLNILVESNPILRVPSGPKCVNC